MLVELRVQNLVIIADAVLHPGRGLCVISGETGAGKSLLMDALGLLRGNRAQAKLIGPAQDACSVHAILEDLRDHDLQQQLEQHGIPCDDQLILRRRITRSGRSQAWINDVPVGLGVLKSIGDHLFDIREQHEHIRLTHPERQRALLDSFGGLESQVTSYRQLRQTRHELQTRLQTLQNGTAESLRERDYCRFLLDELEALDAKPGELSELERRQELLADAETWRNRTLEAATVLYEADGCVAEQLGRQARQLEAAPLPELQAISTRLVDAQELIRDAAMDALALSDQISCDEAERQQVEQRLSHWHELLRKHGGTEDSLFAQWQQLDHRYQQLANLDQNIAEVERELKQVEAAYQAAVQTLKHARQQAFATLAQKVHTELKDLGMPKARLSLHEHSGDSADVQELLLRTNPGLADAPLKSVASGGEAARLALALAVVAADHVATPVLVVDEVDSGVGGRLGLAIACKLRTVAAQRSVLAITHTPQIAAAADRHYLVVKHQSDDQTSISVTALDGERRLAEMADMLGGGTAARNQAKALLKVHVNS
jgi:DNA repair protein RecN (Recombination protein N)